MIALAAVWRWLASLPRIVWAFVFCVALGLAALWFTYHAGQRAGEVTVHRKTLTDSIHRAAAVVESTTTETERAVRMAKKVTQGADSTRARRQPLRDSVEALLAALPEPVVQLIRTDDALVRRDSVALQVWAAAAQAWREERRARIEVDSLRVNQVAVGVDPPRSHRARYVIGGAVLGIAGVLLLHAAVR